MAAKTSSRLATTVQVTTASTELITATFVVSPATAVPLRKQRFTGAQLSKPEDVARQLNHALDEVHAATLPARSYPRNQSITFEGCVFNSTVTPPKSTSAVSLQHNLNTKVRWSVVRWYQPPTGTVTAANIYEPIGSQDDSNVLILRPTASTLGIADVEVWSAG